ncbi:threonine dehydrogenase-like Zn-dependent dehydrogenase [Arthrobacter sp. 1088]|uniref:zinc-dependent alcohol dehydrogenase n=1 Tax=Arthrobacter sp. 1088 TaxID=2817768 RepID=UPI00286233E7|nr:alcohol dehydrogenase catalytic domain-containing protein [Arthrobacter sp. 1088]MDR6688640.1 threonine dehydrogenase-like Zn-dependent dehydrogenase [Arthrobacter sp. 1088]
MSTATQHGAGTESSVGTITALVKSDPSPGLGNVSVARLPEPTPGPRDVLVELIYAGLCHTDVAMVDRDAAARGGYRPSFPLTLGHEFVARVVELGSAVPDMIGNGDADPGLQPGQRVVGGSHVTCRRCSRCLSGRSMLCENLKVLGLDIDGICASRFVVPAVNIVPVPDSVTDETAALAEPFAVAVHAVERANFDQFPPGYLPRVAVVGPGTVGLLVQCALGEYPVTMIGTPADADQLALARDLGATACLAIGPDDSVEQAFDVVIEAAGHHSAVATAVAACTDGGTVVCVGLPAQPTPVDTADLARREINIVGSRAYDLSTWKIMGERLAAAPQLERLISHRLGFDDFGAAIELLRNRQAVKILLDPAARTTDAS